MYKVCYAFVASWAISFGSFAQSEENKVFIKQLEGANEAQVEQEARGGFAQNNQVTLL